MASYSRLCGKAGRKCLQWITFLVCIDRMRYSFFILRQRKKDQLGCLEIVPWYYRYLCEVLILIFLFIFIAVAISYLLICSFDFYFVSDYRHKYILLSFLDCPKVLQERSQTLTPNSLRDLSFGFTIVLVSCHQ